MVLEQASDAIFSLRYTGRSDRFVIEPSDEFDVHDIASVELGLAKDVILFDNERPGTVRAVSHSGQNALAINVLSRTVFDSFYPLLCESIRDGAAIYDTPTQYCEIIVPYSNNRRLGRIALHARSPQAGVAILALDERLKQQSNAYNRLAAVTSAEISNF